MNRTLITGATGYLGRGLVRQLFEDGAEQICIFSRDEVKQAWMREQIQDPEHRLHWFVGDIRDRQRLVRAMQGVELVIHAAALKRVEVGEYNPGEMVKTNVVGAMNVIEAATDAGVQKVIAVSSDKACSPRNTYGASKLMMEKLMLAANNASGANGPRFSVVRYGNVAGSTESVIPIWRRCLAEGKQAVLTNASATRFWMTLQQAVGLVLRSAETMEGGELNIPELPAYSLADLATAMGLPRPYRLVGMGPGEKLHERMLEDGPDSSEVRRMTVDEIREGLTKL